MYGIFEKSPVNVEFLDMNDINIIWQTGDFLDTDHLTERGACRTSQIIASEFNA